MKRKPGLYTMLFLLLMLSGKLLYAATLPVFMDMPFKAAPQEVQQCHDEDTHCAPDHDQEHMDNCVKTCLESCAVHALPSVSLSGVTLHKVHVEFQTPTSRLSRRLEPLYRPPQA